MHTLSTRAALAALVIILAVTVGVLPPVFAEVPQTPSMAVSDAIKGAGSSTAPTPQQKFKKNTRHTVRVFKGRITVQAEAARFGAVMEDIAAKVGFELMISPDVAAKPVTTTFSGVQLQRGIQRLLSLISHRNYFIYYGPDDSIKRIEIYGQTAPSRGTSVRRSGSSSMKKSPATGRKPVQVPTRRMKSAPSDEGPDKDGNITVIHKEPVAAPKYIPPSEKK